jgi:plasmid stabilization system protein ParE
VELRWSGRALADLGRLHALLASVNRAAAMPVMRSLTAAPVRLLDHPRLGERLEEFTPREIRRVIVGHYEVRYEIRTATMTVLRLWHTREDR